MSEDDSPTRGPPPPLLHQHESSSNAENDANSSIIGKVKSRVSSIFPQTISKWFSPSTNDADGSRNGSLRRRRDESIEQDRGGHSDDSDSMREDDDDEERTPPVSSAPPAKRSRLNIHEGLTSFKAGNESLRSSTPLTAIRNENRIAKLRSGPVAGPDNQLYVNTVKAVRNAGHRTLELRSGVSNLHSPEVIEVVPERQFDFSAAVETGSRKKLNIPSTSGTLFTANDFSRARVRNAQPSSHHQVENADQEEDDLETKPTEEEEDEEDDIVSEEITSVINRKRKPHYTNGSARASVDSASESGESRSSSVRPKSGLFNPSTRNHRSSLTNGLNFFSHLEGRKSLFTDRNMSAVLNNSTMSLTSLNRRQFNASLYGSTSALSDSRLLNTFSPFYKGPTTFGGAAAYSKYTRNPTRLTPTLIRPTSSLSTLTSSNNSINQISHSNTGISSTAKRILELINDFPTPLSDAKKMASSLKTPTLAGNCKRFSDQDLASTRSIRLSTVKTPYARPNHTQTRQLAPPIRELQVPSMSQLLQMKKLQSSTERSRQIANQSKSTLNREESYQLPSEAVDGQKHVTKIRQKVTNARPSSKSNQTNDVETLPPVNLPEISLPLMTSVPKIDIKLNVQTSTDKSAKLGDGALTINFAFNQKNETSVSSLPAINPTPAKEVRNSFVSTPPSAEFKFSSPIKVSESKTTTMNLAPINSFKFSNPVPVDTTTSSSSSSSKSDLANFKFQSTSSSSTSIQSLPTPAAVATPVPQLKTGSVLDALKKPPTASAPLSLAGQFKAPGNKWECEVCMIRNAESRDTCEACTTPRKSTKPAPAPALPPLKNNFGDAFKPKSDTWECPSCMIRNKSSDAKCVACNANKPGFAATATPVPSKPADAGFKSLVAQQSAKWECPACMTRNESSRSKCICCEQAKPGSEATSADAPKFSFGSSATASKFTFGFGAGGAAKKEEELKKADENNKSESAKQSKGFTFGIPSTATSSAPTPSFTFGIKPIVSTSNGKDVADTPKSEPPTVTKPAFSFGIAPPAAAEKKPDSPPVATPAPAVDGFKLSSSAISSSKPETESKSSAPAVTTSLFKPIGGFAFGAPAASEKKMEENLPKGGFTFGSSKSLEQKETTSKEETKSTFTFGAAASAAPTKPSEGFTFNSPTSATLGSATPAPATFGSATPAPATFGSTTSAPTTFGSQPKSESTESTSTVTSTSSSSFVFGKPAAPSSTTPVFGATTQNTTPVFGSLQSTSVSTTATATPIFGSASTFSQNSSAPAPASTTFGSGFGGTSSAPAAPAFAFGAIAAKTQTPAPSLFGANAAPAANKTFSSITFGASAPATSKPAETTSVFGSAPVSSNNTFGASASGTSLPTFGSFSATPAAAPPASAFGQTPAASAFNSTPASTPSFGGAAAQAPVAPVFGSAAASTPSFGSFGSGNSSTFGSSAAANPPVFGSGFSSTRSASGGDVGPPAKKADTAFNFGSTPVPAASGGFSFGSNNNNNNNTTKPAFNFSATANAPSFNFTGASETTPIAPFQFNAAPNAASNNIFAPTPTPGAQPAAQQQARRKMRTATRRIPPR